MANVISFVFYTNVVLAESSLELIPNEIISHPSILSDAKRRKKDPKSILLDKTFHYRAMAKLENKEKRGRPDLVHFALISVSSTPVYMERRVKLFVHTINDRCIEIETATRLPKHYIRFRGLFEKLLFEGKSEELLHIREADISTLINQISPSRIYGLSTFGKKINLEDFVKKILQEKKSCVVVGGFPHGHFSENTTHVLNEIYSIHSASLEAHTVLSWLMYELEKQSKNQGLK